MTESMGRDLPTLKPLLDLYIREEDKIWEPIRSKQEGWRASGMGYCPRQQTMKRLQVPETKIRDEKSKGTLKWGDNLHYFIKQVVTRAGLMIEDEVRLRDPFLEITGSIDMIYGGTVQDVDYSGDSENWKTFLMNYRQSIVDRWGREVPVIGGEIKSQSSYAMEMAFKEGPSAHHMMQLGTYYIVGMRNRDQLPRIPTDWNLILVGKDSGGILTFGMTQEWIDKTWDRISYLQRMWNAKDVPDCTCWTDGPERKKKPYPWTVEYCAYFNAEKETCCDLNLMIEAWDRTKEASDVGAG